ncbi:MAG: hypothetical protein ACLVJO_11080 [[Clostridium] scindens]
MLCLYGAGWCRHYVKMVHNGIEYADMQIAEAYLCLNTPVDFPRGTCGYVCPVESGELLRVI